MRPHARDEARLIKTEVREGVSRLAVHRTGTACFVDGALVDLVLEVCIGDGGADAVGIGIEVADNVDLADGIGHRLLLLRDVYAHTLP